MIKETQWRFSPLTNNPEAERKAYNAKTPFRRRGFYVRPANAENYFSS